MPNQQVLKEGCKLLYSQPWTLRTHLQSEHKSDYRPHLEAHMIATRRKRSMSKRARSSMKALSSTVFCMSLLHSRNIEHAVDRHVSFLPTQSFDIEQLAITDDHNHSDPSNGSVDDSDDSSNGNNATSLELHALQDIAGSALQRRRLSYLHDVSFGDMVFEPPPCPCIIDRLDFSHAFLNMQCSLRDHQWKLSLGDHLPLGQPPRTSCSTSSTVATI